MTTQPIWREALNDSTHSLHNFAWLLFGQRFNAPKVAQRFADQQAAILPMLDVILDDEALYLDNAIGGGSAPINAVSLLGEWQIVEAVPRLLTIIRENEDDPLLVVADRASYAMGQMPPAAIEPILAFAEENEERATSAMFWLAKVGQGDERSFAFICTVFERMTGDFNIMSAAESLVTNNVERAAPYLMAQSEGGRFKKYRQDFQRLIAEYQTDE